MSDQNQSNPSPESQKQRWVKYGANVALASVIAIILAIVVSHIAQGKPTRIDTTAAGLYSLKPQTLKILAQVKTPIRLVSLHTKSNAPHNATGTGCIPRRRPARTGDPNRQRSPRRIREQRKRHHLRDHRPLTSPTKADDLIAEVETKYGGEVKKYTAFVDSFKNTIDTISKLADPESKRIKELFPNLGDKVDPDLGLTLKKKSSSPSLRLPQEPRRIAGRITKAAEAEAARLQKRVRCNYRRPRQSVANA